MGDIQPSTTVPLSGDPAGGAPPGGEELVLGRSRGEQGSNGDYHGHITILALFGNEILGVDSTPGQSVHGPLDPLQTQVLDAICSGSGNSICLTVLKADSSTTNSGSTNSFEAAGVHLNPSPSQQGVNADIASSNGNISQDSHCQTAHGDSGLASVSVGGNAVADAAETSSDSQACNNSAPSQSASSTVVALGGNGIPIPAAGCADGTPNTVFDSLAPLVATVCNADDTNGSQASLPYGVREALSVFVLESGDTSLLKATAGAAETHTVAPPSGTQGCPPNCPPPTQPPGGLHGQHGQHAGQGPSGPGAGAGPAKGPSAVAPKGLPFTGADLLTLALIGFGVMGAGLAAMAYADRRRRLTA